MNKFNNETTLFKSNDGELEVTNFRVCKTVVSGGKIEISRIFLENLSSSRLRSSEPKWLLYIGAFLAITSVLGAIFGKESGSLGGLIVAAIPIGLYFLIRVQFLEFVGLGGEVISFPTKMGFEAAQKLLSQVEEAQAKAKGSYKVGGHGIDKLPA